ncbi:PorT family protein [Hymenobacter sp. UV11]|uniref:porin family protein n=1 Tax=Hymenobacter sp. UV11 TaxID=1849735 RepID=UPI00105D4B8C|nr:porin family protein [Hymenobacter sp. UV11]TFZ62900.1 PorT family protein [Hymenobacter sp. UV11]
MKARYLFFPLLLAGPFAHAQTTFSIGPTLGGNLATEHIAADNAPKLGYRLDWLAGAQASFAWGRFALQPALLLSQKGFKDEYVYYFVDPNQNPTNPIAFHSNIRLSYLTLPLNFCFAPLGAKTGPQLFAGPYVSVLLSARDAHTDFNRLPEDITVTDHLKVADALDALPDNYGFRRFDAGLQGGVGYRYEAFLVQASYSLGLRNTTPTYIYAGAPITSTNSYNRAFQLSLSYLFEPKS